MTTITKSILKFEPMITKPIVLDYMLLTVITFIRIISLLNTTFIRPILQYEKNKTILLRFEKIAINLVYKFINKLYKYSCR